MHEEVKVKANGNRVRNKLDKGTEGARQMDKEKERGRER